ncbi:MULTISPECIES: tetraprenyl-beta-curcumene synthase family protein [unclassified Paenibacillus]|uniref:tetraprenyl-beta-curcumene synthase family protein n=1 Tax=unclassified Paenibacillus TaxID=185978 RepID=UPI001AEB8FE5|nr:MULTISPECIES: tetraprenyl-beta-curcumene synthase family protein [unclassified Paenibacillus]
MLRVYRYVLPGVREQLGHWRSKAEEIPDPELRKQALASLRSKQFHCEGGAVYAAANLSMRHMLIPLIVAYQTISDYLDNLCDRSTSLDPNDFRRLHQSMLDAVDPAEPLHDYYEFREERDDGGYLNELVKTCQASIRLLPSYAPAASSVRELVGLYCDLQVYKHMAKPLREEALLSWWELHRERYPSIGWNEFAAATGSTLGVFMLFLAASEPRLCPGTVRNIRDAYFPYICGLHILLDYLIDQEEDVVGGDLNFCSYYDNMDRAVERIALIVTEAKHKSVRLEHGPFHRMIIEGLLALYLSDPKVSKQRQVKQVSRQLMKDSPLMRMFFLINSIWIRKTS